MAKKSVILISNDDGYGAPGVVALTDVLSEFHTCHTVVPDRDRSGSGQSLTLHRPIKVRRLADPCIIVEGTPADCVNLGLSGLLEDTPTMVVSGINAGANLGTDVLYSGTVAAAMEGVCAGLPAMAFSLAGNRHFDTAAHWAEKIVRHILEADRIPDVLFNINIPDVPRHQIKGLQVTTLGRRMPANNLLHTADPRGQERYWIGLPGKPSNVTAGSDFHAIEHGHVSVTPVTLDRLAHRDFDKVATLFSANWASL